MATTKPCSVIDPLNPCGEWVGFTARGACGRCRHPKRCHPKKPRPIKAEVRNPETPGKKDNETRGGKA